MAKLTAFLFSFAITTAAFGDWAIYEPSSPPDYDSGLDLSSSGVGLINAAFTVKATDDSTQTVVSNFSDIVPSVGSWTGTLPRPGGGWTMDGNYTARLYYQGVEQDHRHFHIEAGGGG